MQCLNFCFYVRCKTPPRLSGILLQNITKSMLEVEENGMRSMIAAAVAIPIIAICVLVIFFIVYKIVQSRRQQKRASFRYSAVYRDTVESAHRPPKHRPVSEIWKCYWVIVRHSDKEIMHFQLCWNDLALKESHVCEWIDIMLYLLEKIVCKFHKSYASMIKIILKKTFVRCV